MVDVVFFCPARRFSLSLRPGFELRRIGLG